MSYSNRTTFLLDALAGKLSRRDVIGVGLKLGVASATLTALLDATPEASAAPISSPALRLSRDQTSGSGTLTAIISYGSSDIDPASSYVTIGSTISLICYEMLIQYKGDSTSEYAPMLADSWQASDDQTTYTFKLPANATFHDGSACDAAAVKASFVRFFRLQLGPYMVIARFLDNPEEQIEVVDPQTVTFHLPKAEPLFLAAMASSYGPFVVSSAAVEAHKTDDDPWAHEWFLANAVGTGPYQLVENSVNEQVVFKKFDGYHRGWDGAHFDQVVLRVVPENATRRQLIEQHEADATTSNLTPEDVEALKTTAGVSVLEYPTTRVDWIILNAVKLTKEARQGLSYAFPYDDVINGAYKGLAKRTGPIATTVRGYDPEVFLYSTDLAKAKELLTTGGIAEGTTIDMLIGSEEEIDKSLAQLFQASLAQIGITLEINQVDTTTLNDIIFGDQPGEEKPFLIGSWAWWPDYNDPWNQLSPNFLQSASGGGGSNAGYWVNQEFETLMAQAKDFTSDQQLNDLMKRAQNLLTEQDPPAIFIGERQYFTASGSDIQGFVPNPLYLEGYNVYDMSRAASS